MCYRVEENRKFFELRKNFLLLGEERDMGSCRDLINFGYRRNIFLFRKLKKIKEIVNRSLLL